MTHVPLLHLWHSEWCIDCTVSLYRVAISFSTLNIRNKAPSCPLRTLAEILDDVKLAYPTLPSRAVIPAIAVGQLS